jgi:hypothetical protein
LTASVVRVGQLVVVVCTAVRAPGNFQVVANAIVVAIFEAVAIANSKRVVRANAIVFRIAHPVAIHVRNQSIAIAETRWNVVAAALINGPVAVPDSTRIEQSIVPVVPRIANAVSV